MDYPPEEEEEIEEVEIEEFDEEGYEDQQPLRRSSRVRFDDEVEDKEFWEKENEEIEAQGRKKDKGENIEDFWGQDED